MALKERIATLRRRLPRPKLPRPKLPRVPRVPGGLRPWIALASLGFVLAALVSHGRQLLQLSLDPQGWLWLGLGVGVTLLSLVVNALAQGAVLRWLGARPRWEALVVLYVSTNLRKYLPGGIWHIASRVQAFRSPSAPLHAPLSTARALLAALLDPLLAAVAALALVPLGGWQNGLALLCLLPLGLLVPHWLDPLLLWMERRRARELGLVAELEGSGGAPGEGIGGRWPVLPLLAELVFVLIRFGGFACCVMAFELQHALDAPLWLAGFALAWTAGLVVPGAPGGLGVFEAVLLLRLGVALPEAPLLAVALSYRVVATLADLLGAGLVALDARLAGSARPPAVPSGGSGTSQ
ncbi:MAG: UPF0104 family protein [Synechococcaceae cyanobacterium]|nr:UPF0104 family protein [Synechococcaceae cyanobacterium]